MQFVTVLTVVGLGVQTALSSCASQSKDDGGAGATGANASATTSVFGTGSTGSTVGNIGGGGTKGSTPVTPTGQVAQDTVDGLAPITTAQADTLKDPAQACSGWAEEPEATGQPPILEFVIDVTGSMADQPAYPTQANSPSKWTEMQRVLPTAFQSFPNQLDLRCVVLSASPTMAATHRINP